MKCPMCKEVDLVMSDRQGVEIDYCPGCRGVWLDRGELDKIIERSSILESSARSGYAQGPRHESHGENRHHDEHHGRRKSWLGELFD